MEILFNFDTGDIEMWHVWHERVSKSFIRIIGKVVPEAVMKPTYLLERQFIWIHMQDSPTGTKIRATRIIRRSEAFLNFERFYANFPRQNQNCALLNTIQKKKQI